MAFVRKKVKTFKWPVEVTEPSEDRAGEFDKFQFTAVFKRVKLSELEALGEESGLPLLKKVMIGWENIQDEGGKEVPFSSKELEAFSDDVDWVKAVLGAYAKTYEEAESGN